MTKRISLICLVQVLAFFCSLNLANAADYTLHPGDEMHIAVWGEETLNQTLTVLPDGTITFPLAGRLGVQGSTSTEVEKKLTSKLHKFIPEPVVTVSITAVSGNRVFVIGKVNNPGAYILQSSMTVAQILSLAGGFDRFADTGEIKVIRSSGATTQFIEFDYGRLLSGDESQASILLEAGDVIVVP